MIRTVLLRNSVRIVVAAAALCVIVMAAGGGEARAFDPLSGEIICSTGVIVVNSPCPSYVLIDYRESYGWPYGGSPVPDPGRSPSFQVGSTGSYEIEAGEWDDSPGPFGGPPFPAGQISFTESGALPSGVTFTDNGDGTATVAWTPAVTSTGTYPFTVTVNAPGENGCSTCSTETKSYTLTVDPGEAPQATSYKTPDAVSGSPFDVSFDRPVKGVDTSDFTVVEVGSPSSLAGSVSCLDSTQSPVDCTTGPVSTAQFSPSAPLWAGEEYFVNVNPSSSGVVGYTDNQPVALSQGYVRAATVVQADQNPPLTYNWGVVQNPSAIGGSYQMAQYEYASVHFHFKGTQLALTFWHSPQGGEVAVGIGNSKVDTLINTYAATPGDVTQTFTGLPDRGHDVAITVQGTKQGLSTGTQVGFDAASANGTPIPKGKISESWEGNAVINGYAHAEQKGASVSLHYRGNGVTWYALAGPDGGKATATIDGVRVGTFNLYAKIATGESFPLSYAGIADMGHNLKITATGTKSAKSTDSAVSPIKLVLN